jgi:TldD protein
MTYWQRRNFLKTGGGAALATALPGVVWSENVGTAVQNGSRISGTTQLETSGPQSDYKAIALRALDAARSAGAQYADVRITYIRDRVFTTLFEREELGIGVRALVGGYWGFASSSYCTLESAVSTGRESVAQAKVNAFGQKGPAELTPISIVTDGHWVAPVRIDPFNVPIEEVRDWVQGMSSSILHHVSHRYPSMGIQTGWSTLNARKIDKILLSTEGTYVSQTFYEMDAEFKIGYGGKLEPVDCFSNETHGWERIINAPLEACAERTVEKLARDLKLPQKPVEVGRYTILFDGYSIADLLGKTFGAATQIDRALGYEANAGGTSYLGPDPLKFLGTPVAAPHVTVTANRSVAGGLATTHWDDEGVVPHDFPLVRDGHLVDYQTTREQAAWLAPWYKQHGTPMTSHGCANTTSALNVTMEQTPNISLTAGSKSSTFDDMLANLDSGLSVLQAGAKMDYQSLNGLGVPGDVYEVRHGKPVARITNAGLLFRSPEFWKSIAQLGGADSFRWYHIGTSAKGEPVQRADFSIGAVPAVATDVTVIDITRKA